MIRVELITSFAEEPGSVWECLASRANHESANQATATHLKLRPLEEPRKRKTLNIYKDF